MDAVRRRCLAALSAMVGTWAIAGCSREGEAAAAQANAGAAPTQRFPFQLSDAQWRERLTPAQYNVLRRSGTEFAFSSPLDKEHRTGVFTCAGCAHPLFYSKAKFNSGTGWPSFTAPLPDAIGISRDTTYGMVRDGVHCRNCGGHLGHRFDDGPPPTHQRYCMNGVAMQFRPA